MTESTIIHKENPLGTEPVGKLLLAFSVPQSLHAWLIRCTTSWIRFLLDRGLDIWEMPRPRFHFQ